MNRFVCPLLAGGLLALSMLCQAAAQTQALPRRLPPPVGSVSFGSSVTVLVNGNMVVTDPDWTGPGNVEKAGAVYLYDGATLEVITTLTGSRAGDRVGAGGYESGGSPGVTALPNSGFVVGSPFWNEKRGAVTWCGGGGVVGTVRQVSTVNSLTGSLPGDAVGSGRVKTVGAGNGNYVVCSPSWNERQGAVTWGSGTVGVVGEISAANSLTGRFRNDAAGSGGVEILANGNYAVKSPKWYSGSGAVTVGSGAAGVAGEVSTSNSLTGDWLTKGLGGHPLLPLPNGSFVVFAPYAADGRGALTWVDGNGRTTGAVSEANSLVGLGIRENTPMSEFMTVLANGNYVLRNPSWNGNRGAAVWGSATAGVAGVVSAANALTGSEPSSSSGAGVGSGGVTALPGGNFLVVSPHWGVNRGAVTWGDGGKGVTGVVSADNSLVNPGENLPNSKPFTSVSVLANGHFVAAFPNWSNRRGAVVHGSGPAGARGEVSAVHALTGSEPNDFVAGSGITALTSGNYVVNSPYWNHYRGAATWCDGWVPAAGQVTAANSLTGGPEDQAGVRSTALADGNYVVCSPVWDNGRGAVTWGSGATGLTGGISAANSLTGTRGATAGTSSYGDRAGGQGVVAVGNGNYAVTSPEWGEGRGAVTWVRGGGPATGEISAANSLIGNDTFRAVGSLGIVRLDNGGYLVKSPRWTVMWTTYIGAWTWGSGAEGVRGELSAANSLLNSGPDDLRGFPRPADHGVRVLPGGAYVVSFPGWNGYRGALAWGSATTGVHGEISASNCLLGTDAFPLPAEIVENGQGGLALSGIGSRRLPGEPEPPSGVFIPVDGESGIRGWPTSANGFIGSPRDPVVKPSSAWDRTRGRWVMGYGPDNAVVVFGSAGFTGVTGPQGRDVRDESIPARERGTDFGAVLVNGRRPRTFTVTDAGTRRLVLTGDTPVRVTGAHAAEFTVTRQPSLLSPDASSHHFEITFKPAGPGPRTAVVSIASNADGDGEGQNPYSFPIQGAGVATAREVFEDWRAASFGNATGATAPAEDFDSDGVSNLLEFAFGTDPTDQAGGPVPLDYSGPLTAPGGGTLVSRGGPVVFRAPDGTFTAVWLRRLDALGGGLKYVPQFSAGLQTWQAVTAEPVVLASDGVTEAVAMPFPAVDGEGGDEGTGSGDGDGGAEGVFRFFRLAVTLEP